MEQKFLSSNYKNVHFIGVGGAGMSGLAKHLLGQGLKVSGSDISETDLTNELINLGANVSFKHLPANVKNSQCVVYSSAINQNNPELKQATKRKLPIFKRSEVLGGILSDYKTSICVSGSHGKTTATAMIADVLISANVDPTVFLGGESVAFSNYRYGKSAVAVAEACEYKKNFLDLKPNIAVVLNIDNDHPDSYKNMNDAVDAFSKFIEGGIAVVNADDKYADKLFHSTSVTFGVQRSATYTAKRVKEKGGRYSFTACAYGLPLGKINLSVIGKHNIYNALAAIAVADLMKLPFSSVKKALENFKGVKRRAEYLGKRGKTEFFADYAHHPKEIDATVSAFNSARGKTAIVFQPHTYSRTKTLMDEFVSVLKRVDDCIIYKTYAARETFDETGSAKVLYDNLKNGMAGECWYAESKKELESLIAEQIKSYETVLFLGAGDIYDVAKSILKKD